MRSAKTARYMGRLYIEAAEILPGAAEIYCRAYKILLSDCWRNSLHLGINEHFCRWDKEVYDKNGP